LTSNRVRMVPRIARFENLACPLMIDTIPFVLVPNASRF
jgi:hypothetical protein